MNSNSQIMEKGEVVIYIPLKDLHPFPNQPFKVRDDKAM